MHCCLSPLMKGNPHFAGLLILTEGKRLCHISRLPSLHLKLKYVQCCCRDLVEEDLLGGSSPPLPELSEEEWALLLNAPAFRMSTSMQYTSERRRRNASSRTVSSAGRSSAASSRSGAVAAAAGAAAATAIVESSSESESDEDSGEDSAEAEGEGGEEEVETEEEARKRAQEELEADTARAMHFGAVQENEVEKMSAELRAEVRRVACVLARLHPVARISTAPCCEDGLSMGAREAAAFYCLSAVFTYYFSINAEAAATVRGRCAAAAATN